MKKHTIGLAAILIFAFPFAKASAAERYAFGVGEAQGFGCMQSMQQALNACNNWLSQISKTLELTQTPDCPRNLCTCAGSQVTTSSCFGYARHEDNKPCEGKQRFEHLVAQATGFGCNDARHAAIAALYKKTVMISSEKVIIGLRFGQSVCDGHQVSKALADADVTYIDCK